MPFAFVDELICIALACTHLALPIVISTIFFVSLCKRLYSTFLPRITIIPQMERQLPTDIGILCEQTICHQQGRL